MEGSTTLKEFDGRLFGAISLGAKVLQEIVLGIIFWRQNSVVDNPRVNFLRAKLWKPILLERIPYGGEAIVRRVAVQGRIIQGKMSGRQQPRGQFSIGGFSGEGLSREELFIGNCPWGSCLGGNFIGGNCPGGAVVHREIISG